ncbi:DNA-directed RNA polymerase I subunit RPA12 isoform X2 [Mauremys reevesii]|uniref:DNA-directed RNA polymerase I subunit RPA12 isoform X2 n=1 Tax=Mauremys reevesii TaxID=260615 RepID=UPI00193F108F|nr:DNA-directed RNA polymerase I subunit RPA12 isoform X2 [Mauremys reevesii]
MVDTLPLASPLLLGRTRGRSIPSRAAVVCSERSDTWGAGGREEAAQLGAAMELGTSCFQSDLDFCPECGTILPLPGVQDKVTCVRCSFSIDVRDFEGKVVQSCVEFNRLGSVPLMIVDDGQEVKGPTIDRKCPQCGHEGMVYHTRQMRSADEGQTVFYTCGRCKFQEKEDS